MAKPLSCVNWILPKTIEYYLGGLGGNSIGFLDRLTDRLTDRLKMGDGLKMSDFGLGMS